MCDFLERRARGRERGGVKTQRTYAWTVAALLGSLVRVAAAQLPTAAPEGPVALQVDATGMALDEHALRDAIVRELSLDKAPSDAPKLAVALRVVSGGDLTVTLVDDAGRDQSRSVAAPARAEEVPEVTALLVGNLARDEASGLLARLRRPEPAPETAPPAPAAAEPALEPQPELPLESANLTLFHPMTLRPNADERRFALEFGLFYSRIGALSGVGIEAAGVGTVVGDAEGVLLGSIGYMHGGRGDGVMIGGVFGVGSGDLSGASIAGVVAVEQGAVSGAQLGGVVSVAGGTLEGAQIGGAVNVAGSVQGVQTAGVFSMSRGELEGVQLSGAMNLAERISGLQLSLINIGGDVDGAQLGLVNVARDVDGLQLGLVNVAREVDGVSLGLVPYSQRGRTQILSWYNTTLPFNVGVRFHTGALYVMPTFGFDPSSNEEIAANVEGSYAPGLSLGYHLDIGRGFADLDVNASNPSSREDYGENRLDLRYRLLGGYQVSAAFGVFLGGGVRHRVLDQNGQYDGGVKPELSAGIQLL